MALGEEERVGLTNKPCPVLDDSGVGVNIGWGVGDGLGVGDVVGKLEVTGKFGEVERSDTEVGNVGGG